MARKKSEFVSAFGTSFEIFKRIADEVMAQGGSDDDLRRALADDNIVRDMARLLLESSSVTKQVFTLNVDWEAPLEEVLRRCDLDESEAVSEKKPVSPRPLRATRYTILEFDEKTKEENVNGHCHLYGYWPRVSIREFLTYIATLPRSYRGTLTTLARMNDAEPGSVEWTNNWAKCPLFASDGIRRVLRADSRPTNQFEINAVGVLVQLR